MTVDGPSSVIRALSFSFVWAFPKCRQRHRTVVELAPNCRRDYRRSKRQTHWVSRPIRITVCYGCLRLADLIVDAGSTWLGCGLANRGAALPESMSPVLSTQYSSILPFLRLQFCRRGLHSRRVPRTSAIPSSGPPCEPIISSAPAGALSRRMPRRRT